MSAEMKLSNKRLCSRVLFQCCPSMGPRFTIFWASQSCEPARWLSLLIIKVADVDTNSGPTITHKQVWICDICDKQIHGRKPISIRCNRIQHWVHRLAQYTDTWTCHLHKGSRLTSHTDITPPHPSRLCSKPPTHFPPTPPQHKHKSNTPPIHTGLVKPKPSSLIHSPHLLHCPNQPHTHFTHSTNSSSHAPHSSLAGQLCLTQ